MKLLWALLPIAFVAHAAAEPPAANPRVVGQPVDPTSRLIYFPGMVLKAGDTLPDFVLPGSDGERYRLNDFKGKKVVVVAWFPKAFTGGCTAECKSMKEDGEAIRKFNVAYFAASVDTPEENKKFAEQLKLDYPILSDPGKKVAKYFGVLNEDRGFANRWTFYIDKDGKILYIDKGVKTASHGKDISAKLQELGVAEKKS